ncbi:hypothetical protein SCUCBS95973_000895 [Sporothrix curviconia]|uniref:Borealin N-terminal domain-containing protein n=1 Tax=Sporothrix curviconia TaxID=1260050 RepID=A0ABP0AU33_9PEZI
MPPRGRKRKSAESVASDIDAPSMNTAAMTMTTTTTVATGQKVATKTEESPSKRRKVGVTIAQKQALIDNLQLEVTERARKLRAQYNLQAQGLRTRIEIRVNRIPMALRKLKMGDLLLKHSTEQQKPTASKQTTTTTRVPPPVPEKDYKLARSVVSRAESPRAAHAAVNRPLKRLSDQLASGDKENQNAHLDNPKKRQRGGANLPGASGTQPGQVLSPASSNSRLNPRDRERAAAAAPPSSPAKSFIARPMSPTKQASATNLISSMVEKARATRAATTRKPTTSSTASSAAGGATATAARTRGRGAATATAAPASRSTAAATARNARRISGISESSEASTSTVVRKVGRPAAGTTASTARKVTGTTAAAAAKKTVMSSIKKGVTSATTKRAASAKTAASTATASATTRSGRVLRKRD